MNIELNPSRWSRKFKDWVFRCVEAVIFALAVIGTYIAIRIFLWERHIVWSEKGYVADAEVLGSFGDFMAGTIGVLLAFASMYLMFRTLKSQRADNEKNAALMRSQQFSNMFFELLSLYHKQVGKLCETVSRDKTYSGKEFFEYYQKKIYNGFAHTSSYKRSQNNAIKEFQKIYGKHSGSLSVYFRTVYRIYELIESSDIENRERNGYLKIMRAQFTRYELFFLHYNALTYQGKAAQCYIAKYRLTKHMHVFDLLEFKSLYKQLPDKTEDRINGLNNVLYQLWKNIYHVGRNKRNLSEVNDEMNGLSKKYKISIEWSPQSQLSITVKILKGNRNLSPELQSLKDLTPDMVGSILQHFLKCVLIYSSFSLLNDTGSIRIRTEINGDSESDKIKVTATAVAGKKIHMSYYDMMEQKQK